MIEKKEKLEKLSIELSEILKDYENSKVTPETIIKWINQFEKVEIDEKGKLIILEELIRIFKVTYFSKERINNLFLEINKKIADNLKNKKISFLNIQDLRNSNKYKSSSQNDYIDLFKTINPHIEINNYDADNLIYFDDYLISGNSIRQDLDFLLEKDLLNKTVFYFLLVTQNGLYQLSKNNHDKNLECYCVLNLENRLCCKNKSDILWPYKNNIEICNSYDYSNMKFREGFEESRLFKNDDKKQTLEKIFWKAGCYILNNTSGSALLPLGAGFPKTVGSGIISATYRNIPNNAPICLWWGDERENNYWFPLLKRKTNKSQYEEESLKDLNEWL
jgi:hypothetical protein